VKVEEGVPRVLDGGAVKEEEKESVAVEAELPAACTRLSSWPALPLILRGSRDIGQWCALSSS